MLYAFFFFFFFFALFWSIGTYEDAYCIEEAKDTTTGEVYIFGVHISYSENFCMYYVQYYSLMYIQFCKISFFLFFFFFFLVPYLICLSQITSHLSLSLPGIIHLHATYSRIALVLQRQQLLIPTHTHTHKKKKKKKKVPCDSQKSKSSELAAYVRGYST